MKQIFILFLVILNLQASAYLTPIGGSTSSSSGGTVKSVGMSVPSLLSVSGSPVTTTGTLAVTYSGTALPVANGGMGLTTLTANNVILGNGASAPGFVAPGTSGNVLTSNGTTWSSTTPAGASVSIGGTVTGGTANSVLYLGASNVLAQDNSYFFYDYTNHYLGLNNTSPAAHLDAKSILKTVGNPAGGALTFTTVGASTGYTAIGSGTNYIYKVVDAKTIGGVTIYSPTPDSLSVTENIDPSSVNASLGAGSGYTIGTNSSITYTVWSIFADGKRSSTGSNKTVSFDISPINTSATQNSCFGGFCYPANGQTYNYVIYPMDASLRTQVGTASFGVTYDSSLSNSQSYISWTNNTYGYAVSGYLVVNTTLNTASIASGGGATSIIDDGSWTSYSDPGVTSTTVSVSLNWSATPHTQGLVDYYVKNTLTLNAGYVGSTATNIIDSGSWSSFVDPGVVNLNFQVGSWTNAADAVNTYLQFALGKPSNTYDFGGLATSLANDDGTGWASFINTTSSVATPDIAVLSNGVSKFQNTLGGDETPLKAYAPTASSHSQDWYNSSGSLSLYIHDNGYLYGNLNGQVVGNLIGSQSGGTINSTGVTNSGPFQNTTSNNNAIFIDTGLNGSNHENGIIGTYAHATSPTTDFGGGWKMYAQSDNGTEQPQAGIFGSWATAANASYNGRLYLGTFSAANSNNFKEFVRMEMDSNNVPRTAWNAGLITGYTNIWATGTQDNVGFALQQSGTATQDMFRYLDSSNGVHSWVDKNYGYTAASLSAADVTSLGSEKITNGTFTGSASSWTLNTGWTYAANQVTHSSNGTGTLLQTSASMVTPLVANQFYQLQFTMSGWSVGTVTPACGGFTGRVLDGAVINGNQQTIFFKASSTADLTFTPSNTARFNLDNVSLKQVTAGDIVAAGNVIAGTAIGIPSGGTNNGSLSVTQGSVYYGDGSKLVALGPGTKGQILQTQGTAAIPQWITPSGIGIVDAFTGDIVTPANYTYVLDQSAAFAYTINTLIAQTSSGTITCKLQIGGVDVTGISAQAISSTPSTGTATAANTVSVGGRVTLVCSSNSSGADLSFTMKITRL